VADNASSDGRSKNRRVDIVLLSEEGERAEPETLKPAAAPPPASLSAPPSPAVTAPTRTLLNLPAATLSA